MDSGIFSPKIYLAHQEVIYKIYENLIRMILQHGLDLIPTNGTLFWPRTDFHIRHIRAILYGKE